MKHTGDWAVVLQISKGVSVSASHEIFQILLQEGFHAKEELNASFTTNSGVKQTSVRHFSENLKRNGSRQSGYLAYQSNEGTGDGDDGGAGG